MPYFLHKKKNIHYKNEGSGEAVVLLHGFLENLSMWDEIADELSKTHQVIRIDLPGFGKSESIEKVHAMELFAACVHQVLLELKIHKFSLVGHSMGAYVSLALLEMCSDKIEHICLFHSTANADSEEKKSGRERAIKTLKDKQNVYLKTAIPFLFPQQFQEGCKAQIQKMIAEAKGLSPNGISAALKGMQQRKDTNRCLKDFSGKKTYIAGTLDPLLKVSSLRQEALNNGANFLEIDNAGHMSHWENPKMAIELIQKSLCR